jgi:hypothetical protein
MTGTVFACCYVTEVSQGVRSGPLLHRPVPRPGLFQVVEIVFLIGLVAFWAIEYSRVILQADDLLNAGLAGRPDAQMTLTEWWQLYRYDYLHVNGRFTDAVVRVVLQGGREAWAVLGPILMVGVAIGGTAWVSGRLPGSRSRYAPAEPSTWAALALCAALPLSVIAFRPAAAGDGIFWLSAALTHLGSALCVLVGGWPFLARVEGRTCPRAVCWTAPLFLVLANISQETASVTMLSIVIACWILLRGRVGTYLRLLSILSLAAFAYMVFSPGLLGRASHFQSAAGGELSLVQQLLHRGVAAGQIWLSMAAAGVFGVLVLGTALLWLAVRRGELSRRPALLLTGLAVLIAASVVVVGPWSDTFTVIPREAFTGGDVVRALGLAVCLVGCCVFGMSATYSLRGLVGQTPFVLVTGGSAALAVPTSLGITGERAYLISALWWGFTAICLLLAVARLLGPRGTWLPTVVALVGLVALVPTAREINLAMTENYAAWQNSAREISQAQKTGASGVSVGPFPYPAYMCWAAFDEIRYGDYFRLYYDLPPGVELEFRPSEPAS